MKTIYKFISCDVSSMWHGNNKAIKIRNINSGKTFSISRHRLSKLSIKFGFENIFANHLSDAI